jgi:hypothetical protein
VRKKKTWRRGDWENGCAGRLGEEETGSTAAPGEVETWSVRVS